MSEWRLDDILAAPSPEGGGGAESRIFHWLDHAIAALWFTSHSPLPSGEPWTYADAWEQLGLIAGTLEFLGSEHHDARALYAASKVVEVLELFARGDTEEARRRGPQVAADLTARWRGGNWPAAAAH